MTDLMRVTDMPMIPLRQAIDRLFAEALTPFVGDYAANDVQPMLWPPMTLAEDADGFVIYVSLPGVKPEGVEITTQGNLVTISGAVEPLPLEGKSILRSEIPSGRFVRQVVLPAEVDSAAAQATYEQGMLRLMLPKATQAKPKTISVQIPQKAGP